MPGARAGATAAGLAWDVGQQGRLGHRGRNGVTRGRGADSRGGRRPGLGHGLLPLTWVHPAPGGRSNRRRGQCGAGHPEHSVPAQRGAPERRLPPRHPAVCRLQRGRGAGLGEGGPGYGGGAQGEAVPESGTCCGGRSLVPPSCCHSGGCAKSQWGHRGPTTLPLCWGRRVVCWGFLKLITSQVN